MPISKFIYGYLSRTGMGDEREMPQPYRISGPEGKRSLPIILVCWLVAYIPLALIISGALPEDSHEISLGPDDVVRSDGWVREYSEKNGTVRLIVEKKGGSDTASGEAVDPTPSSGEDARYTITVIVEEAYLPERLELSGYGKLYTNDGYGNERTWELCGEDLGDPSAAEWNVKVTQKRTDVPFYRDRGSAIIEGKMLYRDVATLNPPLINLLWVIPALLGGSFLVFRLYLSLFALGASLMIYYGMPGGGGYPDRTIVALAVLLNPLTIYSTVGAVQDDVIIMCMFTAAVLLMLRKRRWGSSAMVGVGMASKLFPVLLLPGFLTERGSPVKRVLKVLLSSSVFTAVLLPFALLARDDVSRFLRLYVTGDSGGRLHGISFWRYLSEVGFDPSYLVYVLFLLGGVLLVAGIWKGWGFNVNGILFVCLFLLLFSKVHSGYYLLILSFLPLFIYGIGGPWKVWAMGVIVIMLDLLNGFELYDTDLLWLPLAASLGLGVLIYSIFHVVLRNSIIGDHPVYPDDGDTVPAE